MKKLLLSFISIIMLASTLCACGEKENNITVYFFDQTSGKVCEHQESTANFSSETLLLQLISRGLADPQTRQISFYTNGSTISLDLSKEFLNTFVGLGVEGSQIILGCLADTFLTNFKAASINITVEGSCVSTQLGEFPKEYTFIDFSDIVFSVDALQKTFVPSISPSTDVTTTPTPTISQKPTPTVSSGEVDVKDKIVSITFDDGPHATYTRKIVDKLKEYNATATFFIVGNRVNESTESAIRYAVENGSEIGIHGYTHKFYYGKCSDADYEAEMSKTDSVIKKTIGKSPTLMRPTGGSITAARIASSKYAVILWNVDSLDWKHKKGGQSEIDIIVNNVMKAVKPGSVILMHEIYKNSYEAFCIIIDKLYSQGYKVVSVTELIGKDSVKPATKYFW